MSENPDPVPENHKSNGPENADKPQEQPPQNMPKPHFDSSADSHRHTQNSAQSSQNSKNKPSIFMIIFTGVIAAFAVVQGVSSCSQWDIMKKQLDLSQRPSIGLEHKRTVLLIPGKDRWTANIEGIFTNHGESVALDIGSWVEMFPFDMTVQFGPTEKRQKEWCDANRHPKQGFVTGDILFPKQTQPITSTVGIAEKDISAMKGTVKGLVIAGCVHYRASYDPPDRETRQTRFAYMLSTSSTDTIMGAPLSTDPTTLYLVKLPALWSAD